VFYPFSYTSTSAFVYHMLSPTVFGHYVPSCNGPSYYASLCIDVAFVVENEVYECTHQMPNSLDTNRIYGDSGSDIIIAAIVAVLEVRYFYTRVSPVYGCWERIHTALHRHILLRTNILSAVALLPHVSPFPVTRYRCSSNGGSGTYAGRNQALFYEL